MRNVASPCSSLVLAIGLSACGGGGDDATTDPDAATIDAPPAIDAPPPIDAAIDAEVSTLPHFSFFVTSLVALQDLAGDPQGFGGDLRFGETGANAGIRGADKLCATIAERSMPGSTAKQWRAFLSAANDGTGNPIHAIDRIGNGPWYDRLGRMLAPAKANLMGIRPTGGDPAIANDFPNEDGVPNHRPDPTMPEVDNHDMLTGTNRQGRLETQDGANTRTCLDWTANAGNKAIEGEPRVGHSWPRPHSGVLKSWMSSLIESGCAPGPNLEETGPPDPLSNTVGSGGGYGGFYCFALVP